MYLRALEITPTSAVSFRKGLMSHKTIASYPFIPPTVLSGFLFRVLKISKMNELPPTRAFQKDGFDELNYFVLENPQVSSLSEVHSLGGYADQTATFSSFRKTSQDVSKLGVTYASELYPFRASRGLISTLLREANQRGLPSDDAAKIADAANKTSSSNYLKMVEVQLRHFLCTGERPEVIEMGTFGHKLRPQPMNWEFTVSEKFRALLVSRHANLFDEFDLIQNYGCKIGKEGFAFVSKVLSTLKITKSEGRFTSSTIIPLDPKITHTEVDEPKDPESVYYFDWSKKTFVREIFAMNGSQANGGYYTDDGNQWTIPVATLEKLGVNDA